jgi:hypothetical protein
MTNYMKAWLHEIHHYACQHLKVASDRMKAHYDCMANTAGFQEADQDQVWLCHLTWMRGKSPKLQSSWEGPYKMVTQINDAVNRIQHHPREKMMMVHLDKLEIHI